MQGRTRVTGLETQHLESEHVQVDIRRRRAEGAAYARGAVDSEMLEGALGSPMVQSAMARGLDAESTAAAVSWKC